MKIVARGSGVLLLYLDELAEISECPAISLDSSQLIL
jgi:hypothetical protein